jgi:hypothetical protein
MLIVLCLFVFILFLNFFAYFLLMFSFFWVEAQFYIIVINCFGIVSSGLYLSLCLGMMM